MEKRLTKNEKESSLERHDWRPRGRPFDTGAVAAVAPPGSAVVCRRRRRRRRRQRVHPAEAAVPHQGAVDDRALQHGAPAAGASFFLKKKSCFLREFMDIVVPNAKYLRTSDLERFRGLRSRFAMNGNVFVCALL